MTSVNQTRPHCVNQMGKTHSKPLAARHSRGKTWARHGHGLYSTHKVFLCLYSENVMFVLNYINRRTAWSEHGMSMAWNVWIRHGRSV